MFLMKRLPYVLVLLLAGCAQVAPTPVPTPTPRLAAEFHPEAAATYLELREWWDRVDPERYVYGFKWNCECPGAEHDVVAVAVKDGRVKGLESVRNNRADLDERHHVDFETMDSLFDIIRDAINDNAASVEITVNAPRSPFGRGLDVFIDRDDALAGDEIGWTLTGLINTS